MRLEDPLNLQSSFISFAGVSAPSVAPAGEARLWFDQANSQLKFSLNGGAYSNTPAGTAAPPASATQASLLLDSGSGGTAFAGSANGTVLGINLGAGTSDLINAQKAGAARFSVTETGIMTSLRAVIGGTTAVGTAIITATDTNTIALILRPAVTTPSANTFAIQNVTGGTTYLTFGGANPLLNLTNNTFGIFYNGQISNNHRVGATSDTAAAIPLATKAIAGQTANLFQAIDNAGTARVFIGSLVTTTDVTLTLRAITSQTGALLTLRDAANTAIVVFDVGGRLSLTGSGITVNAGNVLNAFAGANLAGAQNALYSAVATNVPLVAKGFASQSANMVEVRTSADAVLFAIEADGDIRTSRSAAGTSLGSVARKLELFDEAGASIGFVPLYNTIT